MEFKSVTKSRIPLSTSKKKQTRDSVTPKLDKKEQSTETTREMQISKKSIEKTTLSEKEACTLKNWKPKPENKNVSPKNIETLSKGVINLMKTSKTQEIKISSKLSGTGVSPFSKHTDGASNSSIINAKDSKKNLLKSITVPKKTLLADPLYKVSLLRRRSRTELEIKLGKAGPLNTGSSIMCGEKEHNGTEVVKTPVLSSNEICSKSEKSVLPKETTKADSIKSLVRSGSISVPKRSPLERKATKPKFQSKPLCRSKTFHVFDVVPVLEMTTTVGTGNDNVGLDASKILGTPDSESQRKKVLGVNDLKSEVTPKGKLPHRGIFFKTYGAKRTPAAVFNIESKK